MRFWVLATVAALAGCDIPSLPPDPAMARIYQACDAGNTQACASIAQINASRPAFVPQTQMIDPAPFMRSPTPYQPRPIATQTYCRPSMGGNVICTTY